MKKQEYHVTLKTPIGNRPGTMMVNTKDNVISGTLTILAHSFPFTGKFLRGNQCLINGAFKTLLRTAYYKATGNITKTNINLILIDERNTYSLIGTAID